MTTRELPKIVARQSRELRDRPELFGADGESPVLALEPAFDDEGSRAYDHGAVFAEEVRAHDRLEHPRFVLERQEDETLGRAGPLADDDGSRGFHAVAVP